MSQFNFALSSTQPAGRVCSAGGGALTGAAPARHCPGDRPRDFEVAKGAAGRLKLEASRSWAAGEGPAPGRKVSSPPGLARSRLRARPEPLRGLSSQLPGDCRELGCARGLTFPPASPRRSEPFAREEKGSSGPMQLS
ncbi:hypothetical protein P7K49_033971 [Saguinus oedipus]|uniref:Uncharacterized protein n=1 Tax=Saguinus oedipus TaxID=9490 RepID=A0ABQ9TTE9_SAGOE|nr:hypothetical protein P7K49_033971 [Saguinus oedipus]